MTEQNIFDLLLAAMFVASPFTLIIVLLIPAPYGRHARSGWGPSLHAKWGWLLMESAAVFSFGIVYFFGDHPFNPISLFFFFLWQLHYIDRAFIYPFRLRSNKNMPLITLLCGILFNVSNGYLNARYLSLFGPQYPISWISHWPFGVGITLFVLGFVINRKSDNILLNIGSSYKIPNGFLFNYISCPNYLGEVLQWFGWAMATWSLPGLAFALFTASNLIPRAFTHHKWYKNHFTDYPEKRKAMVPFLL